MYIVCFLCRQVFRIYVLINVKLLPIYSLHHLHQHCVHPHALCCSLAHYVLVKLIIPLLFFV